MPVWRLTPAGLTVSVLVVPGATREQVVGRHGDRLKVRVTAPPEDGRANQAVEALLARWLGIPRTTVIAGHTHRQKTVLAPGLIRLPTVCAVALA